MSYTPTSWSTGDTITAAAMNKIENGIANAGGGVSGLCTVTGDTLDKTYNDLLGMLNNGVIPYLIKMPDANTYSIYVLTVLMFDGDYFADWYCKDSDDTIGCSNASADGYMSF